MNKAQNKAQNKASSKKSKMSSLLVGIVGFAFGIIVCFFFIIGPQQQVLMKKEKLLNEFYEFNRQEQERLAEMKNVSESQLKIWVSINEEANRKYQEIFNTLQKQERNYSNPGLYWTTLMLVLIFCLIGLSFWLNRKENVKDIATLENFEIFIDQHLNRIEGVNKKHLTRKEPKAVLIATAKDDPLDPQFEVEE